MDRPGADFYRILEVLTGYEVGFIIVGGVGAVLHGAPVSTFDLDIVHSRDESNIARLVSALESLDAFYRGRGSQRISPGAVQLASRGHQLLMTDAGPLDVLGTIGEGLGYPELIPDSVKFQLADDVTVDVLSLRALIHLNEQLGRDKDLAMLAVLRRTLAEQNR